MNTLACDVPRTEDSRVCHHSLQSEVCVRLARGRVTPTWIGSARACVVLMCVLDRLRVCVQGRGGGVGVEEAVWQQGLPTVPSSVYTHMHSCVPHNPVLP